MTCLRHLGDVLHLLAALAGDFPASLERSPLLSCLRLTLSVGLEIPTGSYLTTVEDAPRASEGNAVDVALVELLAEALASALVPESLHFLHYVLGTHMPHILVRYGVGDIAEEVPAKQDGSCRSRSPHVIGDWKPKLVIACEDCCLSAEPCREAARGNELVSMRFAS